MKKQKTQNLKNNNGIFKSNVGADASVRPTSKVRQNIGITLIALVITIIVMLILVAVTISMAVNGGLFDYAGKATGETQNAIDKEQNLASGKVTIGETTYNSIDEYLGTGSTEDNGTYDETAKDENGLLTANATYINGGYTAVIPKGFAIMPGLNGTTAIADGLVIQDLYGNEFVWIPVTVTGTTQEEKEASFEAIRTDGYSNGKLQTYVSTNGVIEPYSDGFPEDVEEYNEMRTSVIENGGFYIGRYEAGSKTARNNSSASEMVVKRHAYPYNYVTYNSALAKCRSMYATGDYGVASTLCYGVQWDAMLSFMNDDEHDIHRSSGWGNYLGVTISNLSSLSKGSEYDYDYGMFLDWTKRSSKRSNYATLLTTGAHDSLVSKNIFDVAGNVQEITCEALTNGTRITRGGYCDVGGDSYPASIRYDYKSGWEDVTGFRVSLYIV